MFTLNTNVQCLAYSREGILANEDKIHIYYVKRKQHIKRR
jgi:hypothetical protein